MSEAATLETPSPEVAVQSPTFGGGGPGNPAIVVNSMTDLLKTSKNLVGKIQDVPKEQPKEEVKETPKEEVKETPKEQQQQQPPAKGSREESLANLRKQMEAAAKERDELKAKYESLEKEHGELKSKPFELPEDVKTKLTTLEQERERYSKELAAASLERHPEFVEKYTTAIAKSVQSMEKIALAAGVSAEDVKRGMAKWDENTFSEWVGGMNELQRGQFILEYNKANSTFEERQQKLNEAHKEWESMSKTREAQMKAQQEEVLSGNSKVVNKLLKELIDEKEGLSEFADLRSHAEAVAMQAARFEMSPEDVFRNVIASQTLARVTMKQKESIDKMQADLKERDDKIAELEAFIASKAGATPRPNAVGSSGNGSGGGDHVAPWQRIQIKA